jgi:hypothetical protein
MGMTGGAGVLMQNRLEAYQGLFFQHKRTVSLELIYYFFKQNQN